MTATIPSARESICSVLLVGDDADVVSLVGAHLHDPRIRVTVARNAADGVDAFKTGTFDLVLMDIEMPRSRGLEATRTIRFWEFQQNLRPTPIAALTGQSSARVLSGIYSAGCTQYLAKPISKNMLLQTLAQYAGASRRSATA